MLEARVCGFRLMVEKVKVEMLGNIVLPNGHSLKSIDRYKVVDVGDPFITQNGISIPIDFKIGDFVVFNAAHLMEIGPPQFHGGRELFALPVDAVICTTTGDLDDSDKTKFANAVRAKPEIEIAAKKAVKQMAH